MTTVTDTRPHQHQELIADAHPRRAAFNAWFFDRLAWYVNVAARHHKRAAFSDIPVGTVLEVGAGAGANFGYLPAGTDLIALEPTKAMHDRLESNAERNGFALTLLDEGAETIMLPDESVDTVIASLVLCTVTDPDAVLNEIARVLRPGGTFRFVEHVAAPRVSPRYWAQRAIAKPWAWVFEGCDSCRNTPEILADGPFRQVEVTKRRFAQSVFFPVNTAIWGIATK